jgi:hypothetical protein
MGYARPLGQTVSVRHRDLATTHSVRGCIALIQIGILGEGFFLCGQPIGGLFKIQFLAVGNVLDAMAPDMRREIVLVQLLRLLRVENHLVLTLKAGTYFWARFSEWR